LSYNTELEGKEMTTQYRKKVRCAVCETESEYYIIISTNTFGSPDLDTRPPEMQRSTISTWVQQCPKCGYCGSDISNAPKIAESLVRSPEYQKLANETIFWGFANSFLCKAMIDEKMSNYVDATWASIHAAWVNDDANQADQARICRCKAVNLLLEAETHGQKVTELDEECTAILIDLLRRSSQFVQAQECITTRRSGVTENVIARILDFQEKLIEKEDDSCHTIAEAVGEGE
jgi:hypothetical protein